MAAPNDSSPPDHIPSESKLGATFHFAFLLLFLVLIGVLFVVFSIALGKYELLVLAFVFVGASCLRGLLPESRQVHIVDLPMIGGALRLYGRLQAYYEQSLPRSLLFYVFFPITGVVGFFVSKRVRQELRVYAHLVQWMILLLLAEVVASYYRIFQHVDAAFAWDWFYLELLMIYFLCNFFTLPIATASVRLSLSSKRVRLVTVTVLTFVTLGSVAVWFGASPRFQNLVPIHLVLDRRIAKLKASEMVRASRPTELTRSSLYFRKFEQTSMMFLRHQCPRFLRFNRRMLEKGESVQERHAFLERMNKAFQQQMASFSPFQEHRQFFLTTTRDAKVMWGMLFVPFRESIFYTFVCREKSVDFHRRWGDLSFQERTHLVRRWEHGQFQFSNTKRMAQVVVEQMRTVAQRQHELRTTLSRWLGRLALWGDKGSLGDTAMAPSSKKEKAKEPPAPQSDAAPSPPLPSRSFRTERRREANSPSFGAPTPTPQRRFSPRESLSQTPQRRKMRLPKLPVPSLGTLRKSASPKRATAPLQEPGKASSGHGGGGVRSRRGAKAKRMNRGIRPSPPAPRPAVSSSAKKTNTTPNSTDGKKVKRRKMHRTMDVPAPIVTRQKPSVPAVVERRPKRLARRKPASGRKSVPAVASRNAPTKRTSKSLMETTPKTSKTKTSNKALPSPKPTPVVPRKAVSPPKPAPSKLSRKEWDARQRLVRQLSRSTHRFLRSTQRVHRTYRSSRTKLAQEWLVFQREFRRFFALPKSSTRPTRLLDSTKTLEEWKHLWERVSSMPPFPLEGWQYFLRELKAADIAMRRAARERFRVIRELRRLARLTRRNKTWSQVEWERTFQRTRRKLSRGLRRLQRLSNSIRSLVLGKKLRVWTEWFQKTTLRLREEAAKRERIAKIRPLPRTPQASPFQPFLQRFVMYNQRLKEFDFHRALTERLLYDHFGATPTLRRTWWTIFYDALLSWMFFFLQLTMPLHMALIILCRVRYGPIRVDSTAEMNDGVEDKGT